MSSKRANASNFSLNVADRQFDFSRVIYRIPCSVLQQDSIVLEPA